jgi:hypothetical protein
MEENIESSSINKLELPIFEKKIGDIKNKSNNYLEAIKHYKNSIIALKLLFDEEGLLTEEKATELIEEVGVINSYSDTSSSKSSILLSPNTRLG